MKRFIPLCYLCLVFFNSFVDLGHKILIQNVFYIAETPLKFTIFSAIVNAMILLPYLLMFSPAGFTADKFAKSSVLKVTAWAALPLTILITLFYFMGWFWLAFAMTLLLALQSAINSPAKYGYVKELFGQEKLAKANGYVQSLTVAAILLGTFLFSILFQHFLLGQTNDKAEIMQQIAPAGFLLIASSLLESIVSLFLPRFKVAAPKSQFRIKKWVSFSYLRSNLSSAAQAPGVLAAIIGLSVLWGVNQVVVAAYGAYLKEYVAGATPVFVQGVMACAIIGVVIGALYAGRVSRRFIETGTVPIAVIGMAIMLWLMVSVTSKPLIVAVFLIYGVFIGLFIVPLNALIQCNAPEKSLGKVLASNNFLQNVFMFVFLAGTVGLALEKLDAVVTFRVLFVISVLGGLYTIYRLPQSMIRYLVYALVSRFYRLEVFGLKNIPQQGGVLLLGNHTSYLDWAIIAMASPRPVRFVMDRGVYEKRLVHWLFKLIRIIPISRAGSRQAITAIEEALNAGDAVCLFPEGYLSRTGQMGPFLKGYEKAVANTDAVIVPFYVHGLWGSAVSLATKAFKVFTKESKTAGQVLVGFGEPLAKSTPAAELKQAVVKLSNHLWETYAQHMESIPQTWLRRAKKLGRHISMRDAKGAVLSGYQSIAAVMLMKKALRQQIGDQQHVGVLLPASVGGALANLALMALGKTVVNINYTASPEAITHMLKIAEIETVVTAEVFLKRLEARGIDVSDLINQTHCIALEDVRAGISRVERVVQGVMAMVLPQKLLRLGFQRVSPDDTAVLLFSSGSEGLPKGVELSHRNVVINAMQSASILNPQGMDKILGSLPPFHAFGLTVTLLMPLIFGAEVVFSPDPTDAVGIAKAVAKYDLTVLCGTATFLNLYARHPRVHSLMFASLRLVIAGAEKLTEGVANSFKAKFGVDIMQGYGATETAPVASFNVPDMLVKEDFHVQVGNHPGTVGQAVPGTQLKIVDPESYAPLPIGEAGMLLVAGPQIMKGYFKAPEKTAAAIIEQDGQRWYVTGDKAQLDANGVLTILDRYSRFAKIAGEMVSLMAVETEVSRILAMENTDVAVLAVGDEKKGEQLVLFLARKSTQEGVLAELRQGKLLSLWLPKTVISLEEVPKLGSGKTDYVTLKGLIDISISK